MKFLLLKTSPVKRQAAAAAATTTTMEAYQGGFETTPLSLITVKVAAAEHRVSVTYGFVPEMQIRFMESKPAKTL